MSIREYDCVGLHGNPFVSKKMLDGEVESVYAIHPRQTTSAAAVREAVGKRREERKGMPLFRLESMIETIVAGADKTFFLAKIGIK